MGFGNGITSVKPPPRMGLRTFLSPQKELMLPKSILPLLSGSHIMISVTIDGFCIFLCLEGVVYCVCVCVCVVQASSTQCTELKLLHVPFNIRNTFSLHEYSSGFTILQLMDTWVLSMSGPWEKLLWTFLCKSVCGCLFSFLLGQGSRRGITGSEGRFFFLFLSSSALS